jgi:hypothetical protein
MKASGYCASPTTVAAIDTMAYLEVDLVIAAHSGVCFGCACLVQRNTV